MCLTLSLQLWPHVLQKHPVHSSVSSATWQSKLKCATFNSLLIRWSGLPGLVGERGAREQRGQKEREGLKVILDCLVHKVCRDLRKT